MRQGTTERFWTLVLCAVVMLPALAGEARAQTAGAGAVGQVRAALGHGDVDGAARVASAASGADRELGLALVDVFRGDDARARERLLPLAQADPRGEAALELGLLDLRRGRREEGMARLDPIAAVRTFNGPDDYFRLARAAIGIREYLLANDAFQRTADVARADIQTTWGDLFLSYGQPADAMESYRDALAADPNWVLAHLGAARALANDDPEAARAAFEEAASLAPDHPDVLLLLVERQLIEKDVPAARETLDRLAAVRPGSLDEAAWRAAVAYADGGIGAVDAAIGPVRAANPRSALGFRRAGQQAARAYRFADAAVLARRGVEVDPADAEAQSELGLYLMRTGDEVEARAALEASWDLNASSVVTKNLLDLLDTIDTFVVVESGPFVFKFNPEEADVLAPYAIPLAQESYDAFRTRYGFTPEGPILIEVFNRHDDFAVRTMGLPGLVGALGACFGRVITMDSPQARDPGEFSWQATLWHEMAHVFSLQLSEFYVPRWLTEGISVFEEHRRNPAWGRELTLEYARALALDANFGVKGLPDAFKRPESLSMAYFEASLVVEHLVDLNGDEGLRTLLRAYANRAGDAEAFAQAFGRSVDDVDTSFAAFVDRRYGALRDAMANPPSAAAADDVPALRARAEANPGNYLSQWTFGQALVREGDLEAAKAPLQRAAALAPQASGNNSPNALLAQIAEKEDDRDAARRYWRTLLAYDHENVQAARRLAALAQGIPAEEDLALRLVADLQPFDMDVHGQLGRRLLEEGDYSEALVEFQAAVALGPANLADAHADVAETLLRLDRPGEAKTSALRALEQAPTYARAQDLLLEAVGR